MKSHETISIVVALTLLACVASPLAAQGSDGSFLPIPRAQFEGKVGKTYKESEPAWPKIPTVPRGRSKCARHPAG